MRVTHRTPETLVIEDRPDRVFATMAACLGFAVFLVGVFQGDRTYWRGARDSAMHASGPGWMFVIVGAVFVLFGLRLLLFARTTTHRLERGRGIVTVESTAPWQAVRRRELPFDSIADVVLDARRERGDRDRYSVDYVTTQGERISWGDFTVSKDDKLECIAAIREFLGMARAAPGSGL